MNAIPTPDGSRARRGGRWDIYWLLAGFGLLMAFRLGAWPLTNPDEGRYAEIPREMLSTGDWVTPRLDGVKYFEKPPLVYWLVAASQSAFGQGERAQRLVPAIFGLLGVLLTYAGTRKLFGRRAGILAAIVLGTSLFYLGMSRILTLDMVVSVLISGTLFCFILGMRAPPGSRRRLLFYGLYVGAALATLAKGLIGILLTGAVMFCWLLLFNQWKRLRPFYLPGGLLIATLIAAPWHLLAAQRNPDWAWFYFVHEHWLRFTTTVHGRSQPWWFFLPIIWCGLYPWTGFVWPALRMVWRERRTAVSEAADLGFFAVWTLVITVFFSLSDSKLAPYVLPVFPALSVLIGVWLSRILVDAERAPWRAGLRIFAVLSGVLGVAFIALLFKPGLARLDAVQMAAIRPAVGIIAIILIAGTIGGWRAARTRRWRAALAIPIATVSLFFLGLTWIAPQGLRAGTKDLAAVVNQLAKPGDQVFSYHEFFHDFNFYGRRLVGTVSYEGELKFGIGAEDNRDRFIDDAEFSRRWAKPGRVFAVVRKRDLAAFQSAGLAPTHLLTENRDQLLYSNQP